jgi:uncharacterized membrane protein
MNKNFKLSLAAILLIVLAVVMVYIGGFYGPKVILPPIITGIGFIIIALILITLKK